MSTPGKPCFRPNDELLGEILAIGRHRAERQGPEFSEPDFLAGALAVLGAIGGDEAMPAHWLLCGTAGRPIIQTEEQRQASDLWMEQHRLQAAKVAEAIEQAQAAINDARRKLNALEEVLG